MTKTNQISPRQRCWPDDETMRLMIRPPWPFVCSCPLCRMLASAGVSLPRPNPLETPFLVVAVLGPSLLAPLMPACKLGQALQPKLLLLLSVIAPSAITGGPRAPSAHLASHAKAGNCAQTPAVTAAEGLLVLVLLLVPHPLHPSSFRILLPPGPPCVTTAECVATPLVRAATAQAPIVVNPLCRRHHTLTPTQAWW